MVDVKNAKAISEVLHYLKGIRQIDIDKLPKKLLSFLRKMPQKIVFVILIILNLYQNLIY